jgi:outer membrane lipoprotein LolB
MLTRTQVLLFSLTALLTACAPSHITPEIQTAAQQSKSAATRIDAAKHLSAWQITGALAARNKQKNWTASIDWQQQNLNNYQIRLFGPLGGGNVLVKKTGRLITYQDGQKRVTTTNIDQLLYKETGIRVPLHNLYYWVRGVKAPVAIQPSQKDTEGHLSILKQGGYTIRYENYQTVKDTDLPTKLRVTGPGGSLKLVIKHWKIH